MTIILIGDGILDNYQYLSNPDHDLTYNIERRGHKVENYAFETVKLFDVRKGIKIPTAMKRSRKYPYRVSSDERMHPLHYLGGHFQKLYDMHPGEEEEKMVVLSLGGNDINSNKLKAVFGFNSFMSSILSDDSRREYREIIEGIIAKGYKVLLISLYLPYLGDGSPYAVWKSFSEKVVNAWNNFLFELAKNCDVPVLDLARTFNPQHKSHYADDMTHMSDSSSRNMAKCVSHIYKHYEGYKCYYAPGCKFDNITFEL